MQDIAAFMRTLAAELHELHGTLEHPADQSLRQGTQTRGNLFNKRSPVIRQLAGTIEQAIATATAVAAGGRHAPVPVAQDRRARASSAAGRCGFAAAASTSAISTSRAG